MEETFNQHKPGRASRGVSAILAIALLAAAAALAFQPARTAEAGLSWCGGDPLITIDGAVVDITAYVPLDEVLRGNVAGPIIYTVHAPRGSKGRVLLKPDVLVRQEVRFVYDQPRWSGKGTLTVPVDIYVDARRGSFDVMVTTLNLALKTDVHMGRSESSFRLNAYAEGQPATALLNSVLGILN